MDKDYGRLLKKKVSLFAVPINNEFVQPFINAIDTPISKGQVVISYVGGARYNKGFDVMVGMLERLFQRPGLVSNIEVKIQIDVHRQQLDKEKEVMMKSVGKLERLAAQFKNVGLIYGGISMPEYYNLILASDIILVPHRKDLFSTTTSNIFREAIIFGKVPIVAEQTTMAVELKEQCLEALVYKTDNLEDFASVVINTVNNIAKFSSRINNFSKSWRDFYSTRNLVKQILEVKV